MNRKIIKLKLVVFVMCTSLLSSFTQASSIPRPDYSEPVIIKEVEQAVIKEEPLVTQEVEPIIIEEPEPKYVLDDKTLNRLAMQIAIETEGKDIEHKKLVAQCILDRTETLICSDGTVYSTLTWKGQFSYRGNYKIEDDVYEAIEYIFTEGNRVTEERIIYFFNPKYSPQSVHRWFYSHKIIAKADGHIFFSNQKIK